MRDKKADQKTDRDRQTDKIHNTARGRPVGGGRRHTERQKRLPRQLEGSGRRVHHHCGRLAVRYEAAALPFRIAPVCFV